MLCYLSVLKSGVSARSNVGTQVLSLSATELVGLAAVGKACEWHGAVSKVLKLRIVVLRRAERNQHQGTGRL